MKRCRPSVASWFETHGVAVLLTMRVDLIQRSALARVSKDEAPGVRNALLQAALRAAHQAARPRAGGGAIALRHRAGDDGGVIAVDLLQQAPAADRKVVVNLRRVQMKPVIVDDVDDRPCSPAR